ncbi:MAG: DUF2127 domain-containing protein [Candidatus Saccharimonadales bacterium]
MSTLADFLSIDKGRSRQEQLLQKSFIASVLFKLGFGIVEAAAGFFLLFVTYRGIDQFVHTLNGLVLFGYHVNINAAALANERLFVALYVILHGLPKIALAIILMKRKLWGYPLSLVILAGFIIYQVYEITATGSLFMLFLTIFDTFVAYLIINEWRRDKRQFAKRPPIKRVPRRGSKALPKPTASR